ncbi:MAG: hypothetical protein EBR82_50835 [Caulobacteraceae bacterium]|nr:hypothetical protein [Caulobacteraceae bacterium]
MRILVACEMSGIVRDAFALRGHDALSCDLMPSERPGPHVVGDVRPLLRQRWDLVIAHPPCTRLCKSGVRWLHERNLWREMDEACEFFLACLGANADRICVENPIPHRYAAAKIGAYTQIVHPWQHGHGETKSTCLWLRGLPNLEPTLVVDGRRPAVHLAPPSARRSIDRSRTYTGIAAAMAAQWG